MFEAVVVGVLAGVLGPLVLLAAALLYRRRILPGLAASISSADRRIREPIADAVRQTVRDELQALRDESGPVPPGAHEDSDVDGETVDHAGSDPTPAMVPAGHADCPNCPGEGLLVQSPRSPLVQKYVDDYGRACRIGSSDDSPYAGWTVLHDYEVVA